MRAFGFAVQSTYDGACGSEQSETKKRKKKQRRMDASDDPDCNTSVEHSIRWIRSLTDVCSRFVFNGIV